MVWKTKITFWATIIFKKLLDGNLTPHFFARWDNKDPQFSYLEDIRVKRCEF